MALGSLSALVDVASLEGKDNSANGALRYTNVSPQSIEDSQLVDLKRKFKDVLRAYWRQHKNTHEGEDTEQYEVAHRIANSIFNLYWDKPHYAALRNEKTEILNYFVKHIQLSKTREGQSANPFLKTVLGSKPSSRDTTQGPHDSEGPKFPREEDPYLAAGRRRSLESFMFPAQPDADTDARTRESWRHIIPRSAEVLKEIREAIPDQQLVSTILIDGISPQVPELSVRSEIAMILQAQFGLQGVISVLNIGEGPIYKILLSSPQECDFLAGTSIKLNFSGYHTMFRAPPSLLTKRIVSINSPNGTNKKRPGDDVLEEEQLGRKRPKLVESEADYLNLPPGKLLPAETGQFVVDKILRQRWVQNKVQYLLSLKGETQTIKAWIFDEDIFAEFEANRKQTVLHHAVNTGIYPSADQLPEIEQVLGAKMFGSQLMFYVKWAHSNIFAFVPNTVVNKVAPSKVIEFYESRLVFETVNALSSPQMEISSPSVNSPNSTSETAPEKKPDTNNNGTASKPTAISPATIVAPPTAVSPQLSTNIESQQLPTS